MNISTSPTLGVIGLNLALLSCIITYTPGTVWSGFSEEKGLLTLHVLDLRDQQYWINLIQQRYERPLKEIFE